MKTYWMIAFLALAIVHAIGSTQMPANSIDKTSGRICAMVFLLAGAHLQMKGDE